MFCKELLYAKLGGVCHGVLNGVGVFGVYMQSKVKAVFTVPELFDHAITAALYLLRF